jgi:hypothetical protein
MLRNTTDVFRKTMNFDVWQMVDPIKVGVGLSGTIASHKTLTLVVGMIMIHNNKRQLSVHSKEYISFGKGVSLSFFNFLVLIPYFSV